MDDGAKAGVIYIIINFAAESKASGINEEQMRQEATCLHDSDADRNNGLYAPARILSPGTGVISELSPL